MIIDLILARRCAEENGDAGSYDPAAFRNAVAEHLGGEAIVRAMDTGDETAVRSALCSYIEQNEYGPDIRDYARTSVWLPGGEGIEVARGRRLLGMRTEADLRKEIAASSSYKHALWEIDVNESVFGGSSVEFIAAHLLPWAREIGSDIGYYMNRYEELVHILSGMLYAPWRAVGIPLVEA